MYDNGGLDVKNANFTGTVVKYDGATITNSGNTEFYLAENTTVGKYTDDNGGAATAVKSAVNPNGKTVNSITWKYGVKSVTAPTATISGNGSVVYGIVIPEAVQYTETITVEIK